MSECKLKDIYVRNRVAEAKRLIEAFKFKIKYVNTKCNPADILSRGADVNSLKLSNWLLDNGEMFAYAQPQENHALESNLVKVETKSSESVEVDSKCKVESTKVKVEQVNGRKGQPLATGHEISPQCEPKGIGDSRKDIENEHSPSNSVFLTTKKENEPSSVGRHSDDVSMVTGAELPLATNSVALQSSVKCCPDKVRDHFNTNKQCSCDSIIMKSIEQYVVNEIMLEARNVACVETILPIDN